MAPGNYDLYEPIAGGFRARLAAALTFTAGDFGPAAVALNSAGRVVIGTTGAQTRLLGVLIKHAGRGPTGDWGTNPFAGTPNPNAPIGGRAGDAVDIMTDGIISNLDPAVYVAGTNVYARPATGALVLEGSKAAGDVYVGSTIKAGTLLVRFGRGPLAT